MKLQHVGTACLYFEIDGIRFLTDPVFDQPGRTYQFLPGFYSKKSESPSLTIDDVRQTDVVLLSHHHHADNLDRSGSNLVSSLPLVLSTTSAAKSLKMGPQGKVFGLKNWQVFDLFPLTSDLEIIAVPSKHYQKPLAKWIVGETIGFLVRRKSTGRCLYFSGDTVLFDELKGLSNFDIQYAFFHLGGVKFPLTAWLRYTLNIEEAIQLSNWISPQTIVPVHYSGWSHFKEKTLPSSEQWANFKDRVLNLNRQQTYELNF